MNALYYRSLSAAVLGETFLTLPPPSRRLRARKPPTAKNGESGIMLFLLGFFEHGVGEFAPRYIREEENNLSADELRRLAEALAAAGQYRESIRLVSLYTKRDGYQIGRGDLQLSHPRPYKELVEQYAGETGIDPALLFGLIRTESAFDPNAVSRVGAIGLTQLMPATAEEAAGRIRRQGGPDYIRDGSAVNGGDENGRERSTVDLRNPAANIHIGASYLAFLNGRMEDPLLALLAYNGGMNRIRRWRGARSAVSLPPDLFLETVEITETMDYGRSVTAAAAVYRALYY
jgi:soluble lytic murein transglycosylase